MHPEERNHWESEPAPVWDREGVWQRIAERRARRRRQTLRRRLAIAAGGCLLFIAGGVGGYTLQRGPHPAGPDEVLPMMKDRVLDDSILPAGDTLLRPRYAPPPPPWTD